MPAPNRTKNTGPTNAALAAQLLEVWTRRARGKGVRWFEVQLPNTLPGTCRGTDRTVTVRWDGARLTLLHSGRWVPALTLDPARRCWLATQLPELSSRVCREAGGAPRTKLRDMTERELFSYLTKLMRGVECQLPPDAPGALVVVFQTDGPPRYVSGADPTITPRVLRELADRIERQSAV